MNYVKGCKILSMLLVLSTATIYSVRPLKFSKVVNFIKIRNFVGDNDAFRYHFLDTFAISKINEARYQKLSIILKLKDKGFLYSSEKQQKLCEDYIKQFYDDVEKDSELEKNLIKD